MRAIFSLILSATLALPLAAQEAGGAETPVAEQLPDAEILSPIEAWQADPTTVFDASEVDIDTFKWIARPIVVFADTPVDPSFQEQIDNLTRDPGELVRRDVVLISDSDPSQRSDLRSRLRPRGFALVLMGKDGDVELRKPFPWSVRELSRAIDKMPLRQQEMRDQSRG